VYRREVTRLRKDKRLQQEFSRQQIESQEVERKRLAAELHDGLGQDLLVASNELQQFLQEEKGSTEDVARAAALVQESIQNVREIASALHPHQLDRLGFCSAVKAMTQNIAHSSGLSIHYTCENVDGILPKEKEIHVYRIIQEALSNIVRHAKATNVTLQAQQHPGNVEISVTDDGRGFVQESGPMRAVSSRYEEGRHGFGLSSMAERARIIGATFDIRSSPVSGTTVHLTVPHS
jgi:signal transduction histidine kinase